MNSNNILVSPNWSKSKSAMVLTFAIFFSFIALIMLLWGIFAQSYKNKYFPNIKVLGISIGGLSKTEAQKKLDSKIKETTKKQVKLKSTDKESNVTFGDLGTTISYDESLQTAAYYGRNKNLLKQFVELASLISDKEFNPKLEFSQETFDKYLNDYIQKNTAEVQQPQLSVKNAIVSIVPGKSGVIIDQTKLKKDLLEIIETNSSDPIEVVAQYVQPESPDLPKYTNAKTLAEKMLDKTVILNYNGRTFTATKSNVGGWLSFKYLPDSVLVNYSDASVSNWISLIARNIDIKAIPTVLSFKGDLVSQGKEGLALDRNDCFAKIKAGLNSGNKSISINVITNIVPIPIERLTSQDGPTPGMSGGRYIEIDISQQMLYIFEGTNLIGGYRVSTGKSTMPTPLGTFSVLNKNPRAYSAKYGLYMPWWNAITTAGHGIHELPEWPNGYKEGQGHLGIPVSHGCIRLGVGPAQTVYNFAPVGTPVFIHR